MNEFLLEAIREALRRNMISTNDLRGIIDPHFTDRVEECLEQAQKEREKLGHNFVATEHLLLAMLTKDQPILKKLGITYEQVLTIIKGTEMV